MLTRDQILSAQDIKTTVVEVPEWGGSVLVAALSGTARDALQAAIVDNKQVSKFESALVAAAAVDENNVPIFTAADVDALCAKNAAVVSRVAAAAMKLSGIGAAATDEAEKNSEAAPSGSSGTA
ncbi:hypothetical protein AB4851_08740 [Burkholderia sp. 22PA0099]|uniref:hypothetical protein n=1 Tax=Burkholderia sp. 22PA0099 TaxID=3237372 RepID=UPI0039C22705